jgi:hypothetical protein
LGEGAKAVAGADPSLLNVGVSALAPMAVPALKGVQNFTGRILSKKAAPVGQTAESVVDPLVQKGKDLMVKLGAKPDLGELAQDVAGITRPAAEAAQKAASQAAADTERATATAAAKAEADIAAASIPVNSALNDTMQALQKWGAGEPSSLDKKFLEYTSGLLKDMKKQVNALYKKVRKVFPEDARVTPRKSYDDLRKTIREVTKGQSKKAQSAMVKHVKEVMFPPKAKNGNVVMPRVGDVIAMRKYASKAGKIGTEFAGEDPATMKTIGKALRKLEHDMARDYGAGELLDKAKKKAAKKLAYQKTLKTALGLRGGKTLAEASTIPARDKAAENMLKGIVPPLEQIMTAAPPGMKREVMADIVNRAIDPSKGPEHMVAVIKAIAKSPEVNELVFKNLPPGARKQLLGFGADAERALAKRETDIITAKAAEKAKVATAKANEQAAREAAAQAERLDIALAPKLRSAGGALRNGDIRPLEEMLKSAPGKEGEVVASTLYHTLFDPTKKGPEALEHMTDALVDLEASPAIMKRVKSFLPTATSDIEALTDLAKIVHSGTAAGGTRAEGPLIALHNMGAWAGGKTGGTLAAIGTTAAGGRPLAAGAAGAGGYVLGRILASRFAKDSTIQTKVANAFLASDVGRGLLRHLALEKPITQGYLNQLSTSKLAQAAARVYGMRPEQFLRKLAYGADQTLRETGEQALTSSNTTEDE